MIEILIIVLLILIILFCRKKKCQTCAHAYNFIPKTMPKKPAKTLRESMDGSTGNNMRYIDREGSDERLTY